MSDRSDPRPALPESVEERVYEALLGGGDPTAAIEALVAQHREHEKAIRAIVRSVRAADTAVGKVKSVAGADAPSRASATLPRGARIGPYEIVRELGRGGFGVVYLAEQREPVRRRVALKVVSSSAAAKDLLQRFEAERQVLAQLDHPGIARILEAGRAEDGSPFFAMDYFDGLPLAAYCDEHRLSIDARLSMFVAVCGAIHHAHQRGVVHRDLKPGNVIVDEKAGEPFPHVIDFGLAKAIQGTIDVDNPSTTEFGRLLGTPEYMSPEQAAGMPVDTRTDVYSLGVILYELLTGALPFSSQMLRERGLASVVKVLNEAIPKRPSTMLADDDAARAQLRQSTTRDLRRRLRGDLDEIAMACLHKDRERRYASIAELAADVRRHLAHEPISVGPPSVALAAWKFTRRHRALVAGAFVAATSLLVAVAITSWSLVRVTEARDLAVRNADVAQQNAIAAAIAAAQGAGDSCRADAMRRHLASVPEEQRDLEWRVLAAQTEDASVVVPTQCSTPQALVVLRDEAVFFDVNTDAMVTFALSGKETVVGKPHPWHFANAAASRDRSKFAVGGVAGQVCVVDATTKHRTLDFQLKSRERPVQCIALSSDGAMVAAANSEAVELLDANTGATKRTLRGHRSYCWSAAFSADDTMLATGDHDGEARIWDVATGKSLQTMPHGAIVRWIAFHPSGKTIATAARDGVIRLWNVADGALLAEQQTSASIVHSCEFSPDGELLVSIQSDGSVRLYSAASLRNLGSLRGHSAYVSGLGFTVDGKIVTTAWDGTLRVWEPLPRRRFDRLEGMMGSTFRLALHPSDPVMAACSLGGEIAAWNLDGRSLRFAQDLKAGMLHGLAWSAEGTSIFTCGDNDKVYELSGSDGFLKRSKQLVRGLRLRDISLSPSLDKLVVTAMTGQILVVDPKTLEVVGKHELPANETSNQTVYVVAASRSASALVCELEGTLRHWDLERGAIAWDLKDQRITACAFGPDETTVVVGDRRGAIRVLDADSGRELRRFGRDSESYHVKGLFVLDGGTRLVTSDQRLRIWDFASGTELLALDTDRFGPGTICADVSRGVLATGSGFFTDPAEVLVWPLSANGDLKAATGR
jgi:WD40 repeat protein/serine/threonine protein kinase